MAETIPLPTADQLHTPKAFLRIFLGLVLCVLLGTQGRLDPTIFNLLSPPGEIENWLGLPGALTAGLLFDVFGKTAWLLAGMIILTRSRKKRSLIFPVIHHLVFVLLISSLLAVSWWTKGSDALETTGVWGMISHDTLIPMLGKLWSIGLMTAALLLHSYGVIGQYRLDGSLPVVLIILLGGMKQKLSNLLRSGTSSYRQGVYSMVSSISNRMPGLFRRLQAKGDKLKQRSSTVLSGMTPQGAGLTPQTRSRKPEKLVSPKPLTQEKKALHDALEAYQKTNYPGNDIEIKDL